MKNALPILLALTLVTGYIDALAFIGFHHVFTANMSGNTILLGITLVQLIHPLGIHEGPSGHFIAIVSFAVGAAGAVLYLRKELHPRQASTLIAAEAVLVLLGFWGRHVGDLSIVALAAAAGAQSVLAARSGIPGISTTYVSGTILRAVSDAMHFREPKHLLKGADTAGAWLAYGLGAAVGAAGFLWLRESALLPAAGAFVVLAFFAGRG